jgi:predicted nucleic acid-binding protein
VLSVLVDTSTWLDLAGRRDGQTLVVPLRLFEHWGELRLLVPALVVEEFDRNRPNAEERVAKSLSERIRGLRRDLQEFGVDRSREWLEMTQHVQMVSGCWPPLSMQTIAPLGMRMSVT